MRARTSRSRAVSRSVDAVGWSTGGSGGHSELVGERLGAIRERSMVVAGRLAGAGLAAEGVDDPWPALESLGVLAGVLEQGDGVGVAPGSQRGQPGRVGDRADDGRDVADEEIDVGKEERVDGRGAFAIVGPIGRDGRQADVEQPELVDGNPFDAGRADATVEELAGVRVVPVVGLVDRGRGVPDGVAAGGTGVTQELRR